MHSGNQILADSKVAGITLHALHKLFLSGGRRSSGADSLLWFLGLLTDSVYAISVVGG